MKKIFIALFALHFVLITISVFDKIDMVPDSMVNHVAKAYAIPFFEQNWTMFSNPPTTTRKVYFQYHIAQNNGETKLTDWYDVNTTMYEYNKKHYLSVAQRLIKYESGCLNSIFERIQACQDPTPDRCIAASPGFVSLRNYARIIFQNSNDFSNETFGDTRFVIKIVEENYPDFENRKLDYFDESNRDYGISTTKAYKLY